MERRRLTQAVDELSRIVDQTAAEQSHLVVFPAMYRAVTIEVCRGLDEGFFALPDQLERLAVLFADRYIDAFHAHRRDEPTTESWRYAFRCASGRPQRMIIQDLLLGMNTHINLDLGIATAQAAGVGGLPVVYEDFVKVNEILYAKVDSLQEGLNAVSPWMRLVDRIGFTWDEAFMRFGIRTARDLAWRLAQDLADQSEGQWQDDIARRDRDTRAVAALIAGPVSLLQLTGLVVGIKESRDMRAVAAALSGGVDLDLVDARVATQRQMPGPGPSELRSVMRRGARARRAVG